MNFPLYIAKRYLISKSSQSTVNIINFVTFFVIVVGAAALFIVLSGFAGLKDFSLSFTNSFDPDLVVEKQHGKFLHFNDTLGQKLQNIEGITHYSKILEERVYLTFKDKNYANAYIKGVDANYHKVTAIDSAMHYGTWINNTLDQVVMGIGIHQSLGIGLNRDLLKVIVPKLGKGSGSQLQNNVNQFKTTVSGVYNINEDQDKKYVYAELDLVQAFLEKDKHTLSSIAIKLNPEADEIAVSQALEEIFKDQQVLVKNRIAQNGSLHKMLNTEYVAIYLIFTLVLIIALFNLVGAIIMMILDKKESCKTLYFMGVTLPQLRKIYFFQGLLVTIAGGIIGLIIASFLIWTQLYFKWLTIGGTGLAFPVAIKFQNIIIVFFTILILGFIASKIAAARINQQLIAP